jgi:hypothetical protein
LVSKVLSEIDVAVFTFDATPPPFAFCKAVVQLPIAAVASDNIGDPANYRGIHGTFDSAALNTRQLRMDGWQLEVTA